MNLCISGEGQAVTKKLVWHTGGCHCGAVRFKVKAAEHLSVDKCKYELSSYSYSPHPHPHPIPSSTAADSSSSSSSFITFSTFSICMQTITHSHLPYTIHYFNAKNIPVWLQNVILVRKYLTVNYTAGGEGAHTKMYKTKNITESTAYLIVSLTRIDKHR